MKYRKITLFVILCLMASILSGCAEKQPAPKENPAAALEQQKTEPAAKPQQKEEKDKNTEPVKPAMKTFGVPAKGLLETLSSMSGKSGDTGILSITPTEKDMGDGTISRTYDLSPGVQFIVYEEISSGNLASVFLCAFSDETDKNGAVLFGRYCAMVTACFASDNAELAEMDTALNIANTKFSEDITNFYDGKLASFMFSVDSGTAMLLITPA